MTKEEFKTGILEVLKNPDSALVAIEPFIDAYAEQAESLEALTKSNEEADRRIRELQDTNMKLYLRSTGEPEKEEEKEEVDIDAMSLEEYLAQCELENKEENK